VLRAEHVQQVVAKVQLGAGAGAVGGRSCGARIRYGRPGPVPLGLRPDAVDGRRRVVPVQVDIVEAGVRVGDGVTRGGRVTPCRCRRAAEQVEKGRVDVHVVLGAGTRCGRRNGVTTGTDRLWCLENGDSAVSRVGYHLRVVGMFVIRAF
jgi:hypothetical protein